METGEVSRWYRSLAILSALCSSAPAPMMRRLEYLRDVAPYY